MIPTTKFEPTKTLVLYPYTRGFSYVVMENPLQLIEFKLISPKKFNKERLLNSFKRIIEVHKPITLVLEDCSSKYCRKGKRTQEIINEIAKWSKRKEIPVKFYSREQVRIVFERWKAKTKFEIALVLSRNILELQPYMYDKPKYPEREVNIDALFCAVSLGVTKYFLE